jgi:triphosphoribosyl-dephospho-CoA synthase
MKPLSAKKIAWACQAACRLEACAEKPGNVTRHHSFHDATFDDFMASAEAIGPVFKDIDRASVGETVLHAVKATRQRTGTNTNLGMILLLAPLAKAASIGHQRGLQPAVAGVLQNLDVDDARHAYTGIRLACPGGLGRVDRYDVGESDVTLTLREAMEAAMDRDTVAREYATNFKITFDIAYPILTQLVDQGLKLNDAIVQTFLKLLARIPDTLIVRKSGMKEAERVSVQAQAVLDAGGVMTQPGRIAIEKFDARLRDATHGLNPGTTADLVTAVLFVWLSGRLRSISCRHLVTLNPSLVESGGHQRTVNGEG